MKLFWPEKFENVSLLHQLLLSLMVCMLWLPRQAGADIQFESVKPIYLIGSPAFISVVSSNETKNDGVLNMNYLGLPGDLRMFLVASNGIALEARPVSLLYSSSGSIENPGEMPLNELYPFKAGEKVRLSYDLSELFDLRESGKYKVQIRWGSKEVLAETEINLLKAQIAEKKPVEGRCYILPRLTVNFTGPGYQERPTTKDVVRNGNLFAFVFIQCNLVVNKVSLNGKELWFLNVEGNKVGKREGANLFDPLSVPTKTKIPKAELDSKGQLWIALEANGKHSLVIWNLLAGSAQTAINWQAEVIEIGTTLRTNGDTGNRIVIAGIAGKTKISTLSYGVAPKAAP